MKRSRRSRSLSPFRKHSEQCSRSRSRDFYSERSHDHRDSREYRPRDSPERSLYRSRSRERAYRSRTPSERGDHAERCGKGATSLLGRKKKRSGVSAVRHMLQSVMSGFQKSLEAFGDNASNSFIRWRFLSWDPLASRGAASEECVLVTSGWSV